MKKESSTFALLNLKLARRYFAYALSVFFIALNTITTTHSQPIKAPTNLKFTSYQKAITYLGSLSKENPKIANSPKIFVGRFYENTHQVYCEPLASNFKNDLISSIKLKKAYVEDTVEKIPMIKGEFKRQFANRKFIKARIKIGTFIRKNQQSLTFYISPWVEFPTKGFSPNEKSCLLRKKIGSRQSVMVPRDTVLRESPATNARIVSKTNSEPIKLIGFINEIDHRWWVFLDANGLSQNEQYLYAQNSTQFIINDNFDSRSQECQSNSNDKKTQNILTKGRRLFKQSLKSTISKQGFHRSKKPDLFGIRLLKMCQEIDSDNINYKIHYEFSVDKPLELSHDIEFKQDYAGKIKYYDISGEIDSFSQKFIKTVKKELIGLN
jgi:hypothetical protein